MTPTHGGPDRPAPEPSDPSAPGCYPSAHLARYLDDRLEGAEAEAVEAHVAGCRACRAGLEGLADAGVPTGRDDQAPPAPYLDLLKRMGPPRTSSSPPHSTDATTGDGRAPALPAGSRPAIPGFRIVREVGRGGMGVVYEAQEIALDRRVALKVIAPPAGTHAPEAERFRREARAAARLHHTNIVPVFGVGEAAPYLFYAMQFIEGEGLDAVSRRGWGPRPTDGATVSAGPGPGPSDGPPTLELDADATLAAPPGPGLPAEGPAPAPPGPEPSPPPGTDPGRDRFREAARVALQVAQALDYAHRQGILHRDVKPSNVLIDDRGDAWVADFGLAKSFDGDGEALTRTGDIVGTLRYMAPERFDGRSDVRGDVYALGVTLYELLTSRPLFDEPNRARLIEKVLREEPPWPRSIDRRVPRDLETVALKAMAKAPSARYASAGEMAEDLRLYLAGEPIRARRLGLAERAARWVRREPTVSGLAASVVLAILVGFGLTVWKWREATRRTAEAVEARREARRTAADLTLDRALGFLDRGETVAGRLWLARSLETPEMAPDSRRLARLNLAAWAASAPRLLRVLPDLGTARHLEFGPDPSTITIDSAEHGPRAFDLATGAPVAGRDGSLHRWDLSASPDGEALARAEPDGTVVVRDRGTGRPLGPPIRAGAVKAVAVGPGGRVALTIGPGGARFWDVASGEPRGAAPGMPAGAAFAVFDGRGGVATMSPGRLRPDDPTTDWVLDFWDASGGLKASLTGLPGLVNRPASHLLGPDGETLAIVHHSGDVGLYDCRRGAARGPVRTGGGFVTALAFHPDGATLATGSNDGRVIFRDVRDGAARAELLAEPGPVTDLAFRPDGRDLGVLIEGSFRLWRLPDRPIPAPMRPGRVGQAVFAPGSDRALVTDPAAGFAQAVSADGRPIGAPIPLGWPGGGVLLAAGPSGPTWATASRDDLSVSAELRLHDARGRAVGPGVPRPNWILSMGFSHDGKALAATGFGGALFRLDASDGRMAGAPLALGPGGCRSPSRPTTRPWPSAL